MFKFLRTVEVVKTHNSCEGCFTALLQVNPPTAMSCPWLTSVELELKCREVIRQSVAKLQPAPACSRGWRHIFIVTGPAVLPQLSKMRGRSNVTAQRAGWF